MMVGPETSASPGVVAPPRRAGAARRHAINLCCAQSVAPMVEEIARNMRGLGFDTRVSCGAEARAALLGNVHGDRPTIHVVCVQGSLQERVLKPLRQALTSRDDTDDQHLFVAVLDLSVPLTMVGHIRRFAEALERRPAAPIRVRNEVGERRRWRETFGHRELAERPTKSYPTVSGRRLTGPQTVVSSTGPRRSVRTISSRQRASRIAPTAKNRQVTAPQAIVDLPPEARAPAHRRQRVPIEKTTVAPVVPPPSRRPSSARTVHRLGAVAHAVVAHHEAVKAQLAETKRRVEAAVLAEVSDTSLSIPIDTSEADRSIPISLEDSLDDASPRTAARTAKSDAPRVAKAEVPAPAADGPDTSDDPEPNATPGPAAPSAPANDDAPPPNADRLQLAPAAAVRARSDREPLTTAAAIAAVRPRRRWPWMLVPVAAAAAFAGWWQVRPDRGASKPDAGSTAVAPAPREPTAKPTPPDPRTPAATTPDPESGVDTPSDGGPPGAAEDRPASDEATGPAASDPSPTPPSDPVDPALAAAIDRRDVLALERYYVTRQRGSATSWADARQRCRALRIDDVGEWRLPWRRELKLIGVVGNLAEGVYWSGSASDADEDSAVAWSTRSRALVDLLKVEVTGEVVCVKRR